MEVTFGALADAANISAERKLNILGIFDTIWVSGFPVQHPVLVYAFRLLAEHADQGRTHTISVSLVDPDAKTLWAADAQVTVGEVVAGRFQHLDQVIQLTAVHFAKPGRYAFNVRTENGFFSTAFQVALHEGLSGGSR